MWRAGDTSIHDVPAEWTRISRFHGVRDVALIWTGVFAIAALAARFLNPASYIVAALLIGGLQNHISSLIHHSVHSNIHPERKVNDWITRLCLTAPQGQMFGA